MISNDPMTGVEAFFTLLLSLIAIAFIIGMVFRAPKLVAVGFIGVLFMFSDATYGTLEVQGSIYGRGVGIFYFSLLHLGLMVAGFAVLCKKLAAPANAPLAPALSKWFIALVALMAGHVLAGLMQGVDLHVILGYNGFMNVINMLVLMYVVIEGFKNDGDKERLLLTIIGLAAIRALFGLARYALFGGDPANPYKNFDNLDIKLVFFEIGDNYVVSVGAFCAAWLLMTPQARLSGMKRLVLFGLLIIQIAAVALSYRRSSLIGLGLMFALLVYRLPGRQRVIVTLFAGGFLTAMAGMFFQQRLQYASNSDVGGILSSLVFDIARDSVEESRFYELYAAAKSLSGNWLTGLGSWGAFTGDDELLFYHGGQYDFVHSGLGHIVLKSGFIGLLLFCGLIWAYTAHYFRSRKYLAGNALLIADAGFAGFLFWIPTLLIGTPIIEIRTMLLLGLTLALPFVAVRRESYKPQVYNNDYTPQYAAA
jgi:hypothetical protein